MDRYIFVPQERETKGDHSLHEMGPMLMGWISTRRTEN